MPTTSSAQRLILLRSFIFRKIHRWKWDPLRLSPEPISVPLNVTQNTKGCQPADPLERLPSTLKVSYIAGVNRLGKGPAPHAEIQLLANSATKKEIGLLNPTLISIAPITEVIASPDMSLTCFIGYAERATNFGLLGDRDGPGEPKTKLDHLMDLEWQEDICRIGVKIIVTVTQIKMMAHIKI